MRAGNLAAALAQYEAAYSLINPSCDSTAPAERTQAALSAGLTALKSGRPWQAARWYAAGSALVRSFAGNAEVRGAAQAGAAALTQFLTGQVDAYRQQTGRLALDGLARSRRYASIVPPLVGLPAGCHLVAPAP